MKMTRFKDKVVVVTGGARDIGKAISIKFAAEGATVLINYCHSEKEAQETLTTIQQMNGKAILCKADLTKAAQVKNLVAIATDNGSRKIDILVNNSGGLIARKKLKEQDEDFYDAVMDVNFRSLFLVTQGFSEKINPNGAIINLSSSAARDGGGGGSSLYAASKGAISTYTKALAKELGPEGIRVNAVCPGLIDTTFHDRFTATEIRKKVVEGTPVRREGTPQDIANLVAFLASDEASFITGANYDINGGIGFS